MRPHIIPATVALCRKLIAALLVAMFFSALTPLPSVAAVVVVANRTKTAIDFQIGGSPAVLA